MKSLYIRKVKGLLIKTNIDQRGAALIITLLILVVLMMLALSLALQGQMERIMAVNETDSLTALSYAESGLEWAERKIKDDAAGKPDLDDILSGPDLTVATADDNLFGIRTISSGLTLADLNGACPGATCERTASVLYSFDWDGEGTAETFEAFRVGTDLNNDDQWDGPRAIVYLRIEDNYDDPANSGIQDQNDEDWRARIRVMTDYPVFVDASGVGQDPVLATRGTARRRLEGRLAPAQGIAIRTNKQFDGNGTPKLCGACGGVHSNGDMEFNGSAGQVCADATSSDDYSTTGGGPNVKGTSGGDKPEQFIPTINPYDDKYVPATATFDHAADPELNLSEPGVGTALRCGPPTANDPGASKYFALVFKKQSGQNLQVWKAYWDFNGSNSRWLWRLIDQGPTLNAVLDNCGRLVSSPDLTLGPDPCPTGNLGCDGSGLATGGVSDAIDCCGSPWPASEGGDDLTYCYPNCIDPGPDGMTGTADDIDRCRPDGAISACDDVASGDARFYGFAGGNNYTTSSCTTDDSLFGVDENDFNRNAFYLYGGGNNGDAGVPPLPGTFEQDTIPDFDYSVVTQPNRQVWSNDASVVFSPVYNAVIFIFGNMNYNGDMVNGKLQFYDVNPTAPGTPGTYTAPLPNGRWRVSSISYGRIDVRGAPRFAPANGGTGGCAVVDGTLDACHVGFVAGRDLDLAGGGGTGCDADPTAAECNLCPDWVTDPTADCEVPIGAVPLGFEGMFVAHEQVNLSGSSNFAGFVIAEEAAFCVETQPPGLKTRMNGNPDIYYDCEHPPDPWLSEQLRITSWEEVQ